jgi:hypothetical protein
MHWYIVILLTTGQASVIHEGGSMKPWTFPSRAACERKIAADTKIGLPGLAFAFCADGRVLRAAPTLDGQMVVPPMAAIPAPVTAPEAPKK